MKNNDIRNILLMSDWLVILAIVAVGCTFLLFGPGWRECGLFFFLCALCLFPFYRHAYKIKGEKGRFLLKEIPVSRDDADAILSFINGECTELQARSHENGGTLLSLYYQKTGGDLFAQYFDYGQIMQGKHYPVVKITAEQGDILKKM